MSAPLRQSELHARRWRGVDEAVAWATLCSPLDSRAIDCEAVGGGSAWTREASIDAYSQVHAALGSLGEWRRWLVVAYAQGASYADLARRSTERGGPGRKADVLKAHRKARDDVAQRLEIVGLIEKRSRGLDGNQSAG